MARKATCTAPTAITDRDQGSRFRYRLIASTSARASASTPPPILTGSTQPATADETRGSTSRAIAGAPGIAIGTCCAGPAVPGDSAIGSDQLAPEVAIFVAC